MIIWAFKSHSIVCFPRRLNGSSHKKRQENQVHKIKVQKIIISINPSPESDQPPNSTSICMCTGLAVGMEPLYWRLFLSGKLSYSLHVVEDEKENKDLI